MYACIHTVMQMYMNAYMYVHKTPVQLCKMKHYSTTNGYWTLIDFLIWRLHHYTYVHTYIQCVYVSIELGPSEKNLCQYAWYDVVYMVLI